MNKFVFKDYFHDPESKIAKRMLYKSDNVIAFILNIATGEMLPAHTHVESTLLLQILDGEANVVTDGKETPLRTGELIQVDGQESMQVYNTGDVILRLLVSISPIGMDAFAHDADI